MMPRPGEVVVIDRHASVQFVGQRFPFRVIGVHVHGSTPTGWIWLDGYQLDTTGDAVERRRLLVQPAGLRPAQAKPRNAGPGIPRPRTSTETTTRRNR